MPVAIAMSGMSPSARVRGKRVSSAPSGVSVQGATFGIFTCRRQRPIWITSGMSLPAGAFLSVNLPSGPVSAVTSGAPESWPHRSHATPGVKGSTTPLGT